MASSAFSKAVKKKKKRFEESKKAKPGEFTIPKLDGTYTARVRAEAREVKLKDGSGVAPVVRFPFTIIQGEDKGKSYYKELWLVNEDEEKEQKSWDSLSKCLQTLAGVDMDDMTIEDLEDTLADINEEEPVCSIHCKPWESNGKAGLNVFFNELLDDEDEDTDVDDEDEDDEDDD